MTCKSFLLNFKLQQSFVFLFSYLTCSIKAKLLDLLKFVAHMQWCQPSNIDHFLSSFWNVIPNFWDFFFPCASRWNKDPFTSFIFEDMISHGCLEKRSVFRLSRRHRPGIQISLAYPRGVWARQWFYCLKKGNPFVPVRGSQSHILTTPGNVQTVVGYLMICSVILAWCYSDSILREPEKRHKSQAATYADNKRVKSI